MSDIPKSVEKAYKDALYAGDVSLVRKYLENGHVTATTRLNVYGNCTKPPIYYAVNGLHDERRHDEEDENRATIAEMLLLRGADPNASTPLVTASSSGYVKVARVLLEFGAKIDAKNEEGITASMAPYWTSNQFAKMNASAISGLLECPPELRVTTTVAVPSPEDPAHQKEKPDIETMGGGAAAAAVAVSPGEAAALAALEAAKDSLISRGSDRRALVAALRAAADELESTILREPCSSSDDESGDEEE